MGIKEGPWRGNESRWGVGGGKGGPETEEVEQKEEFHHNHHIDYHTNQYNYSLLYNNLSIYI